MKKIIQLILYVTLQILFIPFVIIGLILGLIKEMGGSKKHKVSFSAGQSLQYRWMMHYFGTRPDPLTVKFTKAFPCESHIGLLGVMGAMILANKLFGFKTGLHSFVDEGHETFKETSGVRVKVFDDYLLKHIDHVDQIVLPGSGFDLIMNKFTEGKKIKVFELDQEKTMNIKLNTLKKAGIPHDWITYIPEKLLEAGFDPTLKTLFIWQSVSLYLDEEIVIDAEQKMAKLCNEESIIIQDFYGTALMDGSISSAAKKNMDMISKMGEPWKFTLDMSNNPIEETRKFLLKGNQEMTDHYLFGRHLDIQKSYIITESKKQK